MTKQEFTVYDVLEAGFILEPMVCVFCGSREVVFNSLLLDASCEMCGRWQLDKRSKLARQMKKSDK